LSTIAVVILFIALVAVGVAVASEGALMQMGLVPVGFSYWST